MSAAQAMEGVSTCVSTLLVLTSVSVGVDIHCPAMAEIAMVIPEEKLFSCLMHYIFRIFFLLRKFTESEFIAYNFPSQRFLTLKVTIFSFCEWSTF